MPMGWLLSQLHDTEAVAATVVATEAAAVAVAVDAHENGCGWILAAAVERLAVLHACLPTPSSCGAQLGDVWTGHGKNDSIFESRALGVAYRSRAPGTTHSP